MAMEISTPHNSNTPSLHRPAPPPVALSIAGSDSSGGAGIQADLVVMNRLGVHGCSVITAVIAQNTTGVKAVEFPSPAMVRAQLEAVAADLPPAAVKLGMLAQASTVAAVADFLDSCDSPVVCDPVLKSTSGATLLAGDAIESFKTRILPRVTLLTPNVPEAEFLLGRKITGPEEIAAAAHDLVRLGPKSVLLKGGHAAGMLSMDCWTDGRETLWLTSPRQDVRHTHGGGCVLSSAIAACLARGYALTDALVIGKAYVNQGLRLGGGIGQGRGPLRLLDWPSHPMDMPRILSDGKPCSRLEFPGCGPGPLGIYPIVDRAEWIHRLLPLGIKTIQLRAKDLTGAALEKEVREAVQLGREHGARVFINDAWELALHHGAYGVHLGQDDMPHADLMALHTAGIRLGLSTHNYTEVARALSVRPSYLAIGTLFHSPSKDFVHQPLGLEKFAALRRLIDVPVVAIGGITLETAPEVLAAGADSIAVISDITKTRDLAARVSAWLKLGWKS